MKYYGSADAVGVVIAENYNFFVVFYGFNNADDYFFHRRKKKRIAQVALVIGIKKFLRAFLGFYSPIKQNLIFKVI